MKTLWKYLLGCIVVSGCTNQKAMPEIKADTAFHTLGGSWVITQSVNSHTLFLLDQKTYKPENVKYHYINFDLKRNTIKVTAAGEFGLSNGFSSKLDLRNLKWLLSGDTLHIYGDYTDFAGMHQLSSFYRVSHKGDTLCLNIIEGKR